MKASICKMKVALLQLRFCVGGITGVLGHVRERWKLFMTWAQPQEPVETTAILQTANTCASVLRIRVKICGLSHVFVRGKPSHIVMLSRSPHVSLD